MTVTHPHRISSILYPSMQCIATVLLTTIASGMKFMQVLILGRVDLSILWLCIVAQAH